MAKNNTILYLLAATGAGLYFYNKSKNKMPQTLDNAVLPSGTDGVKNVDAVVDATDSKKLSVEAAIATAKGIADTLEDAKVLIKTNKGTVALTKGRKRIKPTKKRSKTKVKKLPKNYFKNKKIVKPVFEKGIPKFKW